MRQAYRSQNLVHLSIGLLVVLPLLGCKFGSSHPPVHYIVPDGYLGMFKIILDEKNGRDVPLKDGRYTYEIAEDGILKVKSLAPLRQMHDETAAYRSGKEIVIPTSQVSDDVVALRSAGQYSTADRSYTIVFVLGTAAQTEQVSKDLSNPDFEQLSPKIYNQRQRQE